MGTCKRTETVRVCTGIGLILTLFSGLLASQSDWNIESLNPMPIVLWVFMAAAGTTILLGLWLVDLE